MTKWGFFLKYPSFYITSGLRARKSSKSGACVAYRSVSGVRSYPGLVENFDLLHKALNRFSVIIDSAF